MAKLFPSSVVRVACLSGIVGVMSFACGGGEEADAVTSRSFESGEITVESQLTVTDSSGSYDGNWNVRVQAGNLSPANLSVTMEASGQEPQQKLRLRFELANDGKPATFSSPPVVPYTQAGDAASRGGFLIAVQDSVGRWSTAGTAKGTVRVEESTVDLRAGTFRFNLAFDNVIVPATLALATPPSGNVGINGRLSLRGTDGASSGSGPSESPGLNPSAEKWGERRFVQSDRPVAYESRLIEKVDETTFKVSLRYFVDPEAERRLCSMCTAYLWTAEDLPTQTVYKRVFNRASKPWILVGNDGKPVVLTVKGTWDETYQLPVNGRGDIQTSLKQCADDVSVQPTRCGGSAGVVVSP